MPSASTSSCWMIRGSPVSPRRKRRASRRCCARSRASFGSAWRETISNPFAAGFAAEHLDVLELAVYWVTDAAHMGLIWSSSAMSLENIRNTEGRPRQRIDYGLVPGGNPTLGAWLLAIPRNARYPEVAEEFLQWATDKDQM